MAPLAEKIVSRPQFGGDVRGRRRAAHPSAESISALIGIIYDCVLDPTKWSSVLDAIGREFAFAGSMLGVLRVSTGAIAIQANAGFAPEWVARVAEFGDEISAIWGGPKRLLEYPIAEPLVQSETLGAAGFATRYYREWGQPQGLIDQVAILLIRDPVSLGNVAFGRHESAGPIGKYEVEGLRLLAPHIRRAITISDLFEMRSIEAASFGMVLDSLKFGVVLVDENLGIVHSNAAATDMLIAGDPIRSEKGALTLFMPAAQAALERAVRQGAHDDAILGAHGVGIPARRVEGEPCVVHVLPLRRGEVRRGFSKRVAAALFIAPAMSPPRMPTDGLALLYDLTPAEARVFEMIAAGATQAVIAATLGIAPSTVKTHILHLFAKTGSKRQLDLVKLAASLSVPV